MKDGVAAAVTVIVWTAVAAPAAPDAREPCSVPQNAQVLAKSRTTVAYRYPTRSRYRTEPVVAYRACHRPSGRRARIGVALAPRHAFRIRLSGRFVGFVERYCETACTDIRVGVLDVGSGSRVAPVARESRGPVVAFRVSRSGALAWMRSGSDPELRKLDVNGEDLVDQGAGLERRSLRLTARRLSWRKSGIEKAIRIGEPRPCGRRRSSTVVAKPSTRVFVMRGTVWGCLIRTNRLVELGSSGGELVPDAGGVRLVRLAGDLVGFDLYFAGRNGASTSIRVVNLANGELFYRWDKAELLNYSSSDIVLRDDGAIAWISVYHAPRDERGTQPPPMFEVRRRVPGREPELLDSGSAIEPESLELSGSTISWRHGSETRTASLD